MQLHIAIDYGCEQRRSVCDRLYSFALVMFIRTSKKQGPFLLATLAADIYCYDKKTKTKTKNPGSQCRRINLRVLHHRNNYYIEVSGKALSVDDGHS